MFFSYPAFQRGILEKLKNEYKIFESTEIETAASYIQEIKSMESDKATLEVDYDRPLILSEGATIRDVCRKISREMISTFRYSYVGSVRKRAWKI